ncbi:MAG: DNA-binding protein [Betaproteobacteria bacterium HGW-Betaproteobacteria-11]|nr:MAG: DNA-binding protein [Betaproteobacteria bacterium HGW-Betaproteobacteria-11]
MISSPETASSIRSTILALLKTSGRLTIARLAETIGVSYEAVRSQIVQLKKEGWIAQHLERDLAAAGRPRSLYRLTQVGENRFPKHYDTLAVDLVDAMATRLGPEQARNVLAEVAETQLQRWEPRLRGKSLDERLALLTTFYGDNDPYMSVETRDGETYLMERNCPYLNVALRRPLLCSVTVSVLTRLLGVRVVREKRFQNGDGCCAFRILADQPCTPAGFELEP